MIDGLKITQNFISRKYEQELIKNILISSWNNSLNRRTQHYGYTYNYSSKTMTQKDYIGPFPFWLEELAEYLTKHAKLKIIPDQIIINEYKPGQGINPHIDHPKIFGDHICSLSLGSAANIVYSKQNEIESHYVHPCSLLEMTGNARYEWKHAIKSVKSDVVDGIKFSRNTRYSITFRKTIIEKN